MGCAQSRIENEESVARCKDRKQFMKDAVSARNAFAAAHSSYTISLKNTGAALSDFAQADAATHHHHQSPSINPPSSSTSQTLPPSSSSSSTSNPIQAPIETLPPPPPPLPDFSPSPLQRSASMPEIPKKFSHSKSPVDPTIQENEDGEEEEEEEEEEEQVIRRQNEKKKPVVASVSESEPPPPPPPPSDSGQWDYFFNYEPGGSLHTEEIEEPVTPEKGGMQPPPPPPPIETPPPVVGEGLPRPEMGRRKKEGEGMVHHQHAASASVLEMRKGKGVGVGVGVMEKRSISLLQVLVDLDDHFLKASESAQLVSKMLEANRMHYHSNFADNRGIFSSSSYVAT